MISPFVISSNSTYVYSGLLRAQEEQLVIVRAEAERMGYERAALTYREQAEV
jgi:hypothetical protein